MSHPYKGFEPKWYTDKPPEKSYRSLLRWGRWDDYKHPNERLYKLMKETFGLTDKDFESPKTLGLDIIEDNVPVNMSQEHINFFTDILGKENVKKDTYTRTSVSYGKTLYDSLRLREKLIENIPDLVLYPRNHEDVVKIVNYCDKNKIPVYVFGGGSSVCRGLEAVKNGVSLDMRPHMNKVIKISEKNHTITVQPGMQGPELENFLNNADTLLGTDKKYTCGHFPQSFEYSSVGGWTVTRGAGQNSTYFGKIEDIVISQKYVTPSGVIETKEFPAAATGPDLDQIMMGSEGTFGILTEVTLKIFNYMPENHRKFSFIFRNWEDAKEASREIMQGQFGYPSVFRLSDPEETDVAMKLYGIEGTFIDKLLSVRGYKPMERCLMLGFTDGEKSFTKVVKKNIKKICRKYKAMYTTGYVTSNWEKGRFKDPYMRDDLSDFNVMLDTLECSVNWENLEEIHTGVRKYCHSRKNTICMTHMSHFYPQGCNLYFIFIAKMNTKEEYRDYQYGILDNIQKYGATMSHHHGIGKMIGPWLEAQTGKNELDVIRALKNHFDPNGIMNPGGTLGLDLEENMKKNFINKTAE
ncbi:MAG: FAD-binding oxidoreductase [Thermotogae bacterium]|nr:FAD-binding oxidoreductase [Thermotogota bacterium]